MATLADTPTMSEQFACRKPASVNVAPPSFERRLRPCNPVGQNAQIAFPTTGDKEQP